MTETLEVGGFQLTPSEWTPATGRTSKPSPFLPIVQASADNGFAAYDFPFTLNGKTQEEWNADLERVIRNLRRAGAQVKPEPVTVHAAASEIKKGQTTISFKTRQKITQAAKPAA